MNKLTLGLTLTTLLGMTTVNTIAMPIQTEMVLSEYLAETTKQMDYTTTIMETDEKGNVLIKLGVPGLVDGITSYPSFELSKADWNERTLPLLQLSADLQNLALINSNESIDVTVTIMNDLNTDNYIYMSTNGKEVFNAVG